MNVRKRALKTRTRQDTIISWRQAQRMITTTTTQVLLLYHCCKTVHRHRRHAVIRTCQCLMAVRQTSPLSIRQRRVCVVCAYAAGAAATKRSSSRRRTRTRTTKNSATVAAAAAVAKATRMSIYLLPYLRKNPTLPGYRHYGQPNYRYKL